MEWGNLGNWEMICFAIGTPRQSTLLCLAGFVSKASLDWMNFNALFHLPHPGERVGEGKENGCPPPLQIE